MDTTVLDLAKDKKIADFADVVKTELKKKILDNEFIKDNESKLSQYQKVSKTMSDLNGKKEVEKSEKKDEETDNTPDNEDGTKPEKE